jgi:hypothetical protein
VCPPPPHVPSRISKPAFGLSSSSASFCKTGR